MVVWVLFLFCPGYAHWKEVVVAFKLLLFSSVVQSVCGCDVSATDSHNMKLFCEISVTFKFECFLEALVPFVCWAICSDLIPFKKNSWFCLKNYNYYEQHNQPCLWESFFQSNCWKRFVILNIVMKRRDCFAESLIISAVILLISVHYSDYFSSW